jgi:GTP-binding protein
VSGDEIIARELREFGRPVILVANKTDDKRSRSGVTELYQLGFEPLVEISAEHGHGVGDLLDEIVSALRKAGLSLLSPQSAGPDSPKSSDPNAPESTSSESPAPSPQSQTETTVAIVGRPNVGKSSLLNRLLKEERVMVSDMPGTTRDAIDAVLTWHRRRFRIVDTAGCGARGGCGAAGRWSWSAWRARNARSPRRTWWR